MKSLVIKSLSDKKELQINILIIFFVGLVCGEFFYPTNGCIHKAVLSHD